jgi:hypothetical protein
MWRVGNVNILQLLDSLDKIRDRYHKKIINATTLNKLFDDVLSQFTGVCTEYQRRWREGEIELVFSCFNNKNCLHVYIETVPLNTERDYIRVSYMFEGRRCHEQMG